MCIIIQAYKCTKIITSSHVLTISVHLYSTYTSVTNNNIHIFNEMTTMNENLTLIITAWVGLNLLLFIIIIFFIFLFFVVVEKMGRFESKAWKSLNLF